MTSRMYRFLRVNYFWRVNWLSWVNRLSQKYFRDWRTDVLTETDLSPVKMLPLWKTPPLAMRSRMGQPAS
ncbi:MAG: hypothetical protein WAM97_18125 [Acidimicrobiales bacterium]